MGKLVEVAEMDPALLAEQLKEAAIVLVRNASGDEELGSAGPNLKGVVLCHSLPHLSHLGRLSYCKGFYDVIAATLPLFRRRKDWKSEGGPLFEPSQNISASQCECGDVWMGTFERACISGARFTILTL